MKAIDWVAIIGAAAWTPQIITWVCRFLTKPKISLHLHPEPEIGYTTYGPIFNVRFALLSEKKDAIINKMSVKIIHENGGTYTFDWEGLSEDLSEIQNPMGPPMSIKKTALPLVVKVLHTGVAQVFVRFQHERFKKNFRETFAIALNKYTLLKKQGKITSEKDIDDIVSEKEFDDVIKLFNSEFLWSAGKYTVSFDFKSPSKFKYTKDQYTFSLTQDDIDFLRKNIDTIKKDILQNAKKENIPDFKAEEIVWLWRHPQLTKKTKESIYPS